MLKKDLEYMLDNDSFFLYLHLMGYPNGRNKPLFFSDLANLRYESLQKLELFIYLLELRNRGNCELKNPVNEDSFLWELAIRYSLSQVQRFFKQHSPLEIEKIFNGEDFQIIISEEMQKLFRYRIDTYVESFMNDNMVKWQKNYLLFEEQKDLLVDKIANDVNKYGSELTYHDCDIPEGCKFFEVMFALQKLNFLKIKHITGTDEASNFFYKIVFIADEKIFPTDKLEKPICETDKGFGFVKFGKKGKRIRISKADSQPYKLLRFLIKPFKLARPIDMAFEKIKTEHSRKAVANASAYLDRGEKIKALISVNKELQKIPGYTRMLKIHINKEQKIIWIDYRK